MTLTFVEHEVVVELAAALQHEPERRLAHRVAEQVWVGRRQAASLQASDEARVEMISDCRKCVGDEEPSSTISP